MDRARRPDDLSGAAAGPACPPLSFDGLRLDSVAGCRAASAARLASRATVLSRHRDHAGGKGDPPHAVADGRRRRLRGVRQRKADQPVRRQYPLDAARGRHRLAAGGRQEHSGRGRSRHARPNGPIGRQAGDRVRRPRAAGVSDRPVVEGFGHGRARTATAVDFDDSQLAGRRADRPRWAKSRGESWPCPAPNDPPLACPLLRKEFQVGRPDPPGHALRQRAGRLSALHQRPPGRQRLFHARLDRLSTSGSTTTPTT